jgi:hypothetical protein
MAMHHTVNVRKSLVNLAVDEALLISLFGFGIHR